ncbi:MAG: hypothetical protein LUQ11_13030 [Methylococcaceae bacterium]|nr:hypothetical protein [Methylococcaceae bacterium]
MSVKLLKNPLRRTSVVIDFSFLVCWILIASILEEGGMEAGLSDGLIAKPE